MQVTKAGKDKRPVVFLDMDGTVVTRYDKRNKLGAPCADPVAIANLNWIIERTGARVVISSAWRLTTSRAKIVGTLVEAGFKYPDSVVGETPDIGWGYYRSTRLGKQVERGDEIRAWLDANPDVTRYAALDDDPQSGSIPSRNYILLNPRLGLVKRNAKQAVRLLGRKTLAARCLTPMSPLAKAALAWEARLRIYGIDGGKAKKEAA